MIVLAVAALVAAILVFKKMREQFSAVDMMDINRGHANLDDKDMPSNTIQGMLANIAEKTSTVQNFYSEQCECKK